MSRFPNRLCWCIALPLLLCFGSVRADSLATTDGDILVGEVTKTASGYAVKTADGSVEIPASKVRKILFDHPPKTPAGDESPAPAPLAKPAAKPKQRAMVTALLKQGQTALASGEFGDARDRFSDALALDPNDPVAGAGLGYAWLKLNKPMKAAGPLEVAAAHQSAPDRDLTMAYSEALLATKNPGKAVKLLKLYLESHQAVLDEPVINALGIALSQMDGSARHSSLYTTGTELYTKLSAGLEAAQSGQKRWGIAWLPTEEVARRQKQWDAAEAKYDTTAAALQRAENELKSARETLHNVGLSTSLNRDAQVRGAQARVNNADSARQNAQRDFDSAWEELAKLVPPDYPKDIPLESVDLTMNPNEAVAAATTAVDNPAETAATKSPAAQPADPPPPPQPTADKPDPHATRYAAAFAIAPNVLVTASAVIQDATNIQITTSDGKNHAARVLRAHQGDGLALLKVDDVKLPCLAIAEKFDPGESATLTSVSFPDVDLFNPMPKSMSATAKAPAADWTVRFEDSPRLPGGPLLSANAVVGVELVGSDSDPSEVPAATLKMLASLVRDSAAAADPAADPKMAVVQVTAEH